MREQGELKEGVEKTNHMYCPILLNQMVAFDRVLTGPPFPHDSLMTNSYTKLVDIKKITQGMSGEQ